MPVPPALPQCIRHLVSVSVLRSSQLAIDKGQRSLSVLGSITLMGGSVVAVGAVRIRCVTVALDLGREGAACEAVWTSIESTCSRGAYVEGLSWGMSGIAHPDDGFDLGLSGSRDGGGGAGDSVVGVTTTTQCVVFDLTAL